MSTIVSLLTFITSFSRYLTNETIGTKYNSRLTDISLTQRMIKIIKLHENFKRIKRKILNFHLCRNNKIQL